MPAGRFESALRGALGLETKQVPDIDWPWSSAPPDSWLYSGYGMTPERAVGLPALLAVILRISFGVGQCRMRVYKGDETEKVLATGSWQYDLLNKRVGDGNPGAWRQDIGMSLAGRGNVYLRKWKTSSLSTNPGRVGALEVLDGSKVVPEKQNGQVVFRDTSGGGEAVTRTRSDILHIRMGALDGGPAGMAPVSQLRTIVQGGLNRQTFNTLWFEKGPSPGIALEVPATLTPEDAVLMRDAFNATHQGMSNAHETAVVGGGTKVVPLPISMRDAQFVEQDKTTLMMLAGVYGIPPEIVGDRSQRESATAEQRFGKFGIGPFLDVIDAALTGDQDLFPFGSGMFEETNSDAITRMSLLERSQAYAALVGSGVETANEIRPLEGLGPHPDGSQLVVVPRGAGPHGMPGADPNTPAAGSSERDVATVD